MTLKRTEKDLPPKWNVCHIHSLPRPTDDEITDHFLCFSRKNALSRKKSPIFFISFGKMTTFAPINNKTHNKRKKRKLTHRHTQSWRSYSPDGILVKFWDGNKFAEVLAPGRGLFPTYLSQRLPEPPSEISESQRTIPPSFVSRSFLALIMSVSVWWGWKSSLIINQKIGGL